MVATYATVEGMLEVLDANPELMEALRARILTREFLGLPRMVADISASQAELASSQAKLVASHAELSASQAELAASQAELAASQIRLENTLREFMEATNARLDSLESAVVVMRRDLIEMKVSVDDIRGRHVEMDLQGKIHAILGRRRLRRVQIVRAAYPSVALPAFCDKVSDSLEDGDITDEQYDRVMDTDIIVRARRRGFDGYVYVAVEASNRLDRGDVDRVERTRRILAAVFPQSDIRAMVYGVGISDEDRLHAESKGIETLLERRAD